MRFFTEVENDTKNVLDMADCEICVVTNWAHKQYIGFIVTRKLNHLYFLGGDLGWSNIFSNAADKYAYSECMVRSIKSTDIIKVAL